jgi:RimJ/RimL family protein N-acetyltransferase
MTKLETVVLESERLHLRQWRQDDKTPFAELNADVEVMEYFPSTLTRDESNTFVDYCSRRITERGWGLWAIELKPSAEFIGFVGLEIPNYDLPFSPCTEIGWRLARRFWGRGYATEAAQVALNFGFEALALDEIVSFTSVLNERSQRVMQKLGMQRSDVDFDHPAVAEGDPLRRHCLYTLSLERWST